MHFTSRYGSGGWAVMLEVRAYFAEGGRIAVVPLPSAERREEVLLPQPGVQRSPRSDANTDPNPACSLYSSLRTTRADGFSAIAGNKFKLVIMCFVVVPSSLCLFAFLSRSLTLSLSLSLCLSRSFFLYVLLSVFLPVTIYM